MRRLDPLIPTGLVTGLLLLGGMYWLSFRDNSQTPTSQEQSPPHAVALNRTPEHDSHLVPDHAASDTSLTSPLHESPVEDAPPEAGPSLSLVHPITRKPIPALSVRVGAPGMYPSAERTTSNTGILPLPVVGAELYTDERLETYVIQGSVEVEGRKLAIWQDVLLFEEQLTGDAVEVALSDAQPLYLSITNPEGDPVPDARVRLQRETAGLIALEATSDSNGVAKFEPLPAGEYVAIVRASGLLSSEVSIAHELSQDPVQGVASWGITLERGKSVYGRVVDSRGVGVPDAFVTAYVEKWGEPRVLPIESFTNISTVPARGVAFTDFDGYFSISGLPAGVAYIGAQAAFGVPSLSPPLDIREVAEIGPVTIKLEPGADVEVLVLGEERKPIAGAEVSWKDGPSGLTSTSVTDGNGLAVFEDVTSGAQFIASARTWRSATVSLPEPDMDGVRRLELLLEPADIKRYFSFRLEKPDDVAITALRFRADRGSVCEANPIDDDDWKIEGCAPGAGTLLFVTRDHGETSIKGTFEDLSRVTLPPPVSVRVTVSPWPEKAPDTHPISWTQRDASAAGFGALVPLDRRRTKMRWEAMLYPGRYDLAISLPREEEERVEAMLHVKETGGTLDWGLVKPTSHAFFVVDGRDHPIDGARVEVWIGKERILEETSQGRAPTRVTSIELEGATVYMMDDVRAGKGVIDAAAIDAPRHVLTMNQDRLASLGRPGEITDRAALAKILGAPLVRDDERELIDARAGTPAANAGIPRGAAFVAARKTSSGHEILYRTNWRGPVQEAFIFSE